MGLMVDALAVMVRDSIGDADASREDWEKALDQVFGRRPSGNTKKARDLQPDDVLLLESGSYRVTGRANFITAFVGNTTEVFLEGAAPMMFDSDAEVPIA